MAIVSFLTSLGSENLPEEKKLQMTADPRNFRHEPRVPTDIRMMLTVFRHCFKDFTILIY